MTRKTKIYNSDNISWIDKVIIYVFLVTNAYVRIVDNNSMVLLISAACLSIAGAYNLIKAIIKNDYKVILFAGMFVLFWVIEILARPAWQYEFKYLISSLCYIGVAYSFTVNKRTVAPYKALFYGISLFLIIKLRVVGVPYSEIMKEGSSYNFISVLLLFYLLILNYVQIDNGVDLGLFPGILFLAICVFSYGRGGIVTALIYCGSLLIAKAYHLRNRKETYIAGIGLVIICFVFVRKYFSALLRSGLLNKFVMYGFDNNGRTAIWSQFFYTCKRSFWDAIFGGDPRVLKYIDYNLHNSFLQLYASLGLILALIVVAIFAKKILCFAKYKDAWMLVVAVSFLARAMTDKLMYRGYSEILFYMLVFYSETARSRLQKVETFSRTEEMGATNWRKGVHGIETSAGR